MKKLLALLLCGVFVFGSTFDVSAQKKGEDVALGVAAGLLGIGGALLVEEMIYEMLELEAFKYVAESRPEEHSCQVKVLTTSIKKWSDISPNTGIAFGVKFFDPQTSETTSKEILVMITAPGWMNEYGVDFSILQWMWIDEGEWLNMKSALLDLTSPVSVTDGVIPLYEETSFEEAADITIQKGIDRSKNLFYKETDERTNLDGLRIWRKGFKHRSTEYVVPMYFMRGDDYLYAPYNEDYSIVWNEKSLGLLLRSPTRFLQISRADLEVIEAFVDDMELGGDVSLTMTEINGEMGVLLDVSGQLSVGAEGWILNEASPSKSQMIEVLDLAIDPEKWAVGDSVLYLEREPLTGVVVNADYEYSPPFLEFEYATQKGRGTKKVATDNKKLFLRQKLAMCTRGDCVFKIRYDSDGSESWIAPGDENVVLKMTP